MSARQVAGGSRIGRQAGLTLVELMVSIVIALILMLAISSTYLGASQAGRFSDVQSRMHEDGQAALALLSQQLRLAGDNPIQPNRPDWDRRNKLDVTLTLFGCDGTFTNATTVTATTALSCPASPGAAADSIAIRYEADRYNTTPNSANVPTDCVGMALRSTTISVSVLSGTSSLSSSTVSKYEAENHYYVAAATGENPSLYCKGNGVGSVAQPMVDNVENMQITYGVTDAGGTSTAVVGYLSAGGIEANAALAALTQDARWSRVLTVRVCVLIRSESEVIDAQDAGDSASYFDCAGDVVASPDLRLRRAYSTTIVLRNRYIP